MEHFANSEDSDFNSLEYVINMPADEIELLE